MTDPSNPAFVENLLLMRKEDFSELFNHAAERGVRAVLAELGLYRHPVALPDPKTASQP
jgi:hypothetical protein